MDLFSSFKFAARGVRYILGRERNARIHLVVALIVILLSLLSQLTALELAIILFAIVLVFLAEIVNTALEKTLDLIDQADNKQVRLVKDMAAGAVLVTAVGAFLIGLLIFWPFLAELLWRQT